MSHVDILGKSRGNNNFQDLKAGAYLRNSKEASVEVSDEGREQGSEWEQEARAWRAWRAMVRT